MKKLYVSGAFVGLLALGFWQMKGEPEAQPIAQEAEKVAVKEISKPLASLSAKDLPSSSKPENLPTATASVSASASASASASGQEMNYEMFRQTFAKVDLVAPGQTLWMLQRLSTENRSTTAEHMIRMLDDIGAKDLNERGRLVYLANEIGGQELLPFWKKVLDRSPKADEREGELIGSVEPNEVAFAIRTELSLAIRNLSIVALTSKDALSQLVQYASGSNAEFSNLVQRREAFYRVLDVDPNAATGLVASLPLDDELRTSLADD